MSHEYSIDCPSLGVDAVGEYRSVRVVVTEVFLDFDPVLLEQEADRAKPRDEFPAAREIDAQ